MTEANDADTIVGAPSGSLNVVGTGITAAALLFRLSGSTYQVWTSGGCAGQGGWTQVASGVTNPTAVTNGATVSTSVVNLCTTSATLEVHGTLTALPNSNNAAGP